MSALRSVSGVAITRTNAAAPGAVGHAVCVRRADALGVLGLYRGSNTQLARIKQINEANGAVTSMHGDTLVSALVTNTSGGAHTPNRAAAKALLAAALSKL